MRLFSGLLVFASVAALASLVGCASDTTPDTSAGSENANGGGAKNESARPDAGGALAAPFTCGRDAIQGEPRPGVSVLEELRAAAGLDVLEERQLLESSTDAAAPASPIRAGSPCSSASDASACESAFADLSSGAALRPPFDEVDFMGRGVRGYYPQRVELGTVRGSAGPRSVASSGPCERVPQTPVRVLHERNACI